MSTTEDQPAAFSPEWFRAQAPYVHVHGKAAYTRHNAWTDDEGATHGLIDLGSVDLTFHDPQQVRDLIARLATLAGEMDAEIRRQQSAEGVVEGFSCDCGTRLPWPAKGAEVTCPSCGIVWEHDGVTIGGGARIKSMPEPESCEQCGATDTPLVDGKCFNTGACARRQQARDAEAAPRSPVRDADDMFDAAFGTRPGGTARRS